jgi:hypothetical protein
MNGRQLLMVVPLSLCAAAFGCSESVEDADDGAAAEAAVSSNCVASTPTAIRANGNDGNVPANVADNDFGTRWSRLGKGSYIEFDLGATKSVCQVQVAWYRGNLRRSRFTVSVSPDRRSFTQVFSGQSSGTSTAMESYAFAPTSGRYVRITVNGNTENDWASITELKAFAELAAPPPPPAEDAGAPPPAQDAGTPVRGGPGIKPTAANTGVPAGTALTVVNGDMTITQDGTVVDAKDIHGIVTIRASHVKITRSIVRGRAISGVGAAISVDSGTDVLLEDTEVAIGTPSPGMDGVRGSNFVARRLDVHGGVDGMKLGNNDVVEYSYVHDMTYFASDPSQGGGPTHNDAIQILSGADIRVTGNQLVVAKSQNAGIQVTQDFGAVTNLLLEGNWADGGGCTFNIAHKGQASLQVAVQGNRFGRNSFYNCPILKSTATTLTGTGNVWDDTGTPVPVQSHD